MKTKLQIVETLPALLAFAALVGWAAAASAQGPNPAKPPRDAALYISADHLAHIAQGVPSKDGKPGGFSARLFQDATYSTSFIRLNEPDQPHAHADWSEVFVVEQGAGVLETGGTITGDITHDSAVHKSLFLDADGQPLKPAPAAAPRRVNPADNAGTAIEGGKQQAVKAGDVILVPAGVAHHWLRIDEPVVYLDIKFPKAE